MTDGPPGPQESHLEPTSRRSYHARMLGNIFEALVALGTLALAGVTVRLSKVTNQSVIEAYRARIDASAQRVIISKYAPRGSLLRLRQSAALEVGVPDGTVTVPRHFPLNLNEIGEEDLAIWVTVAIVNEGLITSLVEFKCPDDLRFDSIGLAGESRDPLAYLPDGRYLLPPGATAEAWLLWWKSASTWKLDAGRSAQSIKEDSRVSSTVSFTNIAGTATDTCSFSLWGMILEQVPEDGAYWPIYYSVEVDGTMSAFERSYDGAVLPKHWWKRSAEGSSVTTH